mgnify:CR=1 FL=1
MRKAITRTVLIIFGLIVGLMALFLMFPADGRQW